MLSFFSPSFKHKTRIIKKIINPMKDIYPAALPKKLRTLPRIKKPPTAPIQLAPDWPISCNLLIVTLLNGTISARVNNIVQIK